MLFGVELCFALICLVLVVLLYFEPTFVFVGPWCFLLFLPLAAKLEWCYAVRKGDASETWRGDKLGVFVVFFVGVVLLLFFLGMSLVLLLPWLCYIFLCPICPHFGPMVFIWFVCLLLCGWHGVYAVRLSRRYRMECKVIEADWWYFSFWFFI